MDPTIAATVIGVLLSVCFAALATAFAWLRSDMNAGFDKVDDRFERLEEKVDGLIMAQALSVRLTDPGASGADN